MTRTTLLIAAVIAAVLAASGLALRAPAVENALLKRSIDQAFAPASRALLETDGIAVFFCGTGSPLPSMRRAQTCTLVFAGGRYFMIDSGTGSWENVQAAGIPGERLAGILLTHFHSDHIGDIGEAHLGSWVAGRETQLPVYGPPGVERIVAGLNETYALDHGYRTAHHGSLIADPDVAGLEARVFDGDAPVVVIERDGLRVTAFPVAHEPVSPAVGYRFDYQGRSVVVSGDTAASRRLVQVATGADVLVHEAQSNFMVGRIGAAAELSGATRLAQIMADIPSYHTTPLEAAALANEAGVSHLVLTHLTPPPDNAVARRIFLRGVSAVRPRGVVLAEDGMAIILPSRGGVTFTKF